MQETLFSGASGIGFVIPTLTPVYEVASGKSLNTWKSHFLFCKTNRIYQDELFLRFRIIIYVSYVCVRACIDIDTDIHLDRCIISPKTNGSMFGNSVFTANFIE